MSASARTVVLISPHFPPSTLAGVHRARHMAKHLPAFGWRPIVLRAAPETYTEANDPALAELVPASVEQVATKALPAGLMRQLGVGDIGIRAYPYLRGALDRLIRDRRPDAVFITGFPFYPMMLADRIKRSGIPLVLDFQDPWVSAYGATRPEGSKEGLAHRLATWLEPNAVRHADYITSVSEVQNREMAERYPWLDAERMAALPIGGDPEDFDALRARPPANPQVTLDPGLRHLSYVGAFLPRAEPLARRLFQALAALRDEQPALLAKVRLNFVGTSNQPDGAGGPRVERIAAEEGVGDLVREHPPRVPYLEALSLLANSDALLLIGSDEAHYTASKIYPALMSGRPYLSLFHEASSAHAILSAAGGGLTHAFDTPQALAALVPALRASLETLLSDKPLPPQYPQAYAPYTARAIAGRFAQIFETIAR